MKSTPLWRPAGSIGLILLVGAKAQGAAAPEKLIGVHSARVMPQSLPWPAEEAGLFKKFNLDFHLVFISSSSIVTAAWFGGDAEMTVNGGIGNLRAYLQGSTDRGVHRRRQEHAYPQRGIDAANFLDLDFYLGFSLQTQ